MMASPDTSPVDRSDMVTPSLERRTYGGVWKRHLAGRQYGDNKKEEAAFEALAEYV
jgi:hypothetical protein